MQIARDELRRIIELTRANNGLEAQLAPLVATTAPQLLAEPGCAVLTAAKLIGEIAGADRFRTNAQLARGAGVAPIPASSGRRDRQRNAALHRLAVNKGRLCPQTAAYSPANKPTAKRAKTRCAASNATSPATSGSSFAYHPHSPPRPARASATCQHNPGPDIEQRQAGA